MKSLRIVLAMVILLVGGVAAVVLSGVIDVAATRRDPEAVEAVLALARVRSVARRAQTIPLPQLGAPAQVAEGLAEYAEMCAVCHGGPGRDASEIAQGLNPAPPQFRRSFHSDPKETFWIVRNGIKRTGMPAFGPTHDDATLWSIVAFLQTIDDLTPAQKAALARGGEGEAAHRREESPIR